MKEIIYLNDPSSQYLILRDGDKFRIRTTTKETGITEHEAFGGRSEVMWLIAWKKSDQYK